MISPLFWERTEFNNFNCKTEVRKSNIDFAGKGRFILEDIEKNECIKITELINVNDYLKLIEEDYDKYSNINYSITFDNYEDLQKLFLYFKSLNLISDREIKSKMSNFIVGDNNNKLYIFNHSAFINYFSNENIIQKKKGNFISCYTTKNLKKNEELYGNYNNFTFPNFYLKWCKDNNIKPVNSFIKLKEFKNIL